MTEQSQSAIVAGGLTKSFPGVRAVDHLSFDVRERNLWLGRSRWRRENDDTAHARGHHAAR